MLSWKYNGLRILLFKAANLRVLYTECLIQFRVRKTYSGRRNVGNYNCLLSHLTAIGSIEITQISHSRSTGRPDHWDFSRGACEQLVSMIY